VCVVCGDVAVGAAAGVAAGVVCVAGNMAVELAGLGEGDMRVGPWAEELQGWVGEGIVAGNQRWVDRDYNQVGPEAVGELGQ